MNAEEKLCHCGRPLHYYSLDQRRENRETGRLRKARMSNQ